MGVRGDITHSHTFSTLLPVLGRFVRCILMDMDRLLAYRFERVLYLSLMKNLEVLAK